MDILLEFERYITENVQSQNTVVSYMTTAKQIVEFVNKPIETINMLDLNNYIFSIKKTMEISSVRTKISALKIFGEWLVDMDVLPETMFRKISKIKKPIVENHVKEYIPTQSDVDAMLEIANVKMKAIILTLISTSCRITELSELTLEDFQNDSVNVVGKGKKIRTVYFNEECIQAVNEYLKIRVDGDYLFTTEQGNKLNGDNNLKALKLLAYKAHVADYKLVSNHCFRRFFGTSMFAKGVDVHVIAELMGHSSEDITIKHYIDISEEMKREAVFGKREVIMA